jgi:hypothetical protein
MREKTHDPKADSARREHFYIFFFAIVLTLFVQFLEYQGILANAEGRLFDFFVATDPWRHEAKARIVTLEIDDETYTKYFRDTSPLNPQRVDSLIKAILRRREELQSPPTVIGVDLLTDSPNEEYASQYRNWNFDTGNSGIVWVSGIANEKGESPNFFGWLFGHHDHLVVQPTGVLGNDPATLEGKYPSVAWGIPVFPREGDLRLRRLLRRVEVSTGHESSTQPELVPTWASAIAREFCETPSSGCSDDADPKPEVFVSYGFQEPQRFRARDVFRSDETGRWILAESTEFTSAITERHTIILIGGTFAAARDLYETPIGRIPGLLLNAYAVQAELSGLTIDEFSRPLTVGLDILIGLAVGYLVHYKGKRFRKVILLGLGSILVAVFISAFSFWLGFLWASCVGVAAGMPLHLLIEVARANPAVHQESH